MTAPSPSPDTGDLIADRYRVERELGRGGMGRVFLAHDLKLDRDIALKVLAPGVHDEPQVLRFEQEARAAGALDHPNILAVHDIGNHAGAPYIISELLQGATLREKLGQPLPLREAVELSRQLMRGLAAANERGIIHRDLKPENLFVTREGTLKILDFGIAKLAPRDGASIPTTETGAILGTAGYMSPEQVHGRAVDHRSDIFSFGAIFYEMLSGKRAFARGSAVETGYAVLHSEPEPLPPSVPAAADRVARRCLEKDPDRRFQSAHELAAALDHLALRFRPAPSRKAQLTRAALVAAPLAATLLLWLSPSLKARLPGWLSRTGPVAGKQLAVLPFHDAGGGPAGEAFSAGLAEILAGQLRQIEGDPGSLHVVSAKAVLDQNVATASEARRALGATLALTGNVSWSAEKVTAIAELVDTRTQRVLAGRNVEVPRTATSTLTGLLLKQVAQMLELRSPELKPAKGGAPAPAVPQLLGDVRPGAYEFYLQGRGYLQRYDRIENLDNALSVFSKALAQDPGSALAWAGKAEAYLRLYKLSQQPGLLADARTSCRQAVELNDGLAAPHLTMGLIHAAAGDYPAAIASFKRSLQLEPANADAVRELANTYDAAGRTGDAEATFRRAIALQPSSWAAYKDLGVFYNRHGRIEEAIPWFKGVIDLTPDNYSGYANLAAMYLRLGRHEEAAATLERSLALNPSAQAYSNLGTVYYMQKRYRDAAHEYLNAVELSPADDHYWGNLADAYRWIPGKAAESARAYREAIAQAEKQVAINPRDGELHSRIAMYWISLGEREAALREIAQAARLSPADGQVLFRSALVYEQSARREQALDAIRTALAGGYSKEEIEKAPPLEALRQDPRYRSIIERK